MAEQHVIVKHLAAIQNLGSIDVLCSDKTGTLTVGEMRVEASSTQTVRRARVRSRSPASTAASRPASAAPSTRRSSRARRTADDAGWRKLDEIPFDFERRRLSIVAERAPSASSSPRAHPTASAPSATGRTPTASAGAPGPRAWARACVRLLAVATRAVDAGSSWTAADERDLALQGFLAFSDPPLPDAKATVDALRDDGVEVKVLTGDDASVACHVVASVGLDPGTVADGRPTSTA